MNRIKNVLGKVERNARPWAIWIWNGNIDYDSVVKQIDSFIESGFGGVAIRPGNDMTPTYLSEEYFELFRVVLERAKAGNIGVRIADDFALPTNGFFQPLAIRDREVRAKRLVLADVDTASIHAPFEYKTSNPEDLIVLAVKLKNERMVLNSVKVLSIASKKEIYWKPTGSDNYKILVFKKEYEVDPDGRYIPNVYSYKTAKIYLEEIFDKYRTNFSKFIPGTFEGLVTEVPTSIPSQNSIPWDDDFVVKYRSKYKKDFIKLLPSLFFNASDERKDRVQMHSYFATVMHERFSLAIETWVKRYRLSQWVLAPERPLLSNENILVDSYSTPSVALSSVGCQNQEGTEVNFANVRMVADCNSIEQKRETISVVGRNRKSRGATLQSIKKEIDMHAQCGASRILIDGCYFNLDHANHIRTPFNPSWYYPGWSGIKDLCTYSARLQQILTGLHLNRTVAVLAPTISMTADYTPDNNSNVVKAKHALDRVVAELQTLNIDFDIITEEILHSATIRVNGEFGTANRVRKGNYQGLIVPYSRLSSRSSFVFFEKLAAKKGTIIFIDEQPQGSIEDGTISTLVKRGEKLLRAKSGFVNISSLKDIGDFLDHLSLPVQILAGESTVQDLNIVHASDSDTDVYLVSNLSDTKDYFASIDLLPAKNYYIADCDDGSIHDIKEAQVDDDLPKLSLSFAPNQSYVIVGSTSKVSKKAKETRAVSFMTIPRSYRIVLKDHWDFVPQSLNALPLSSWSARIGLSKESGGYTNFSESHFEVKEMPESCILVMVGESGSSISDLVGNSGYEVSINGNIVSPYEPVSFEEEVVDDNENIDPDAKKILEWRDYAGRNAVKYDIKQYLVNGFNRISLRTVGLMSKPEGISYPPMIAGDFSISRGSRGWIIDRPAQVANYGSWTKHGFPYLSGTGLYKQEFELPSDFERILLKFSEITGNISVKLNGTDLGVYNWHPIAIDITDLCEQRRNLLEITAGNTMDNVLRMNGRPSGLTGEVYLDVY